MKNKTYIQFNQFCAHNKNVIKGTSKIRLNATETSYETYIRKKFRGKTLP